MNHRRHHADHCASPTSTTSARAARAGCLNSHSLLLYVVKFLNFNLHRIINLANDTGRRRTKPLGLNSADTVKGLGPQLRRRRRAEFRRRAKPRPLPQKRAWLFSPNSQPLRWRGWPLLNVVCWLKHILLGRASCSSQTRERLREDSVFGEPYGWLQMCSANI